MIPTPRCMPAGCWTPCPGSCAAPCSPAPSIRPASRPTPSSCSTTTNASRSVRRPADPAHRTQPGRTALALASVGVLLAAADTYVVVLALPDLMVGVGLDVDELQRAAPIVSMFLLGYVVVLPLAGRISDVAGRTSVLLGSLLVFAAGSLLTATTTELPQAVTGRFLQGAGGGALVPVTLALVADLWPPDRRGVPLGVVGGVQELGAVLGPLYGTLILAVADWRAIFWANLVAGLGLAPGLSYSRRGLPPRGTSGPGEVGRRPRRRPARMRPRRCRPGLRRRRPGSGSPRAGRSVAAHGLRRGTRRVRLVATPDVEPAAAGTCRQGPARPWRARRQPLRGRRPGGGAGRRAGPGTHGCPRRHPTRRRTRSGPLSRRRARGRTAGWLADPIQVTRARHVHRHGGRDRSARRDVP